MAQRVGVHALHMWALALIRATICFPEHDGDSPSACLPVPSSQIHINMCLNSCFKTVTDSEFENCIWCRSPQLQHYWHLQLYLLWRVVMSIFLRCLVALLASAYCVPVRVAINHLWQSKIYSYIIHVCGEGRWSVKTFWFCRTLGRTVICAKGDGRILNQIRKPTGLDWCCLWFNFKVILVLLLLSAAFLIQIYSPIFISFLVP